MNSTIKKQDDGTIEMTVTIPWAEVEKSYKEHVDEFIKHVEIKGFRKGKAPKELAEKQLDRDKVYQEVIKHLIPKLYAESIKTHNLKPIVTPDIQLTKAKEKEPWEFTALTCEQPVIGLDNYKKLITEAKGDLKKDELWIPGKSDKPQEKDENADQKRQRQMNVVLEYLIKNVDIVIPHILIQAEVEQRLSRLLDELQKLGLTIDTYAKSKGMTPDIVRKQHEQEVTNTFKLEFILETIADKEGVTVQDKDIDKLIAKVTDKEEQESLTKNKYYLASLIRRQKTLDRLHAL